jgi:RP/EB family microtubule-associated protein
MSSIGIMDPAFFVGKRELLGWLNDFFELNYTKVEQCATGALHCQILDCLFPGKVPIKKVKFDAKYEYEFVKNFKVLQDVFNKENIPKHIPVEKIVKAKYQDNLELLQWMKNFFETRYGGQEYHAAARRAYATGKKKGSGVRKVRPAPTGTAKSTKSSTASSTSTKTSSSTGAASKRTTTSKPRTTATKPRTTATKATKRTGTKTSGGAAAKIAKLNEELAKMELTVEGLEKERNFYFGKLREVEILCQADEEVEKEIKEAVLAILYQTDDAEEFAAPEGDEGEDAAEEVEDAAEEEVTEEVVEEAAENETF